MRGKSGGGGGFGMVMLLVVMAVVLYLAAKAFKTTAPEITGVAHANREFQAINGSGSNPDTSGGASNPNSGESVAGGDRALSGVREMRDNTAAHTNQMRDALHDAQ